jgi:uncharacterized protein
VSDSPAEGESRAGRSRSIAIAAILAAVALVAGIGTAVVLTRPATRPNAGERVELKLPAPPNSTLKPAPDPALEEDSPDGKLPIIGKDGRQPWQIYARPFDAADHRPRVALVIFGLGLDAELTRIAIDRLPGQVTLAFSPYAHDLPDLLAAARGAGHEVLLGLPMEPSDYPRLDPGPEALLTSLEPAQNLDRLRWVLSRGTGYVGLVGIMGDRFTAARAAMEPILEALKSRGLLYVDDAANSDGGAGALAHELGLAWAVADRTLDGETMAPAIDHGLADLETVAAKGGVALGLGAIYPVTLERIIDWVPSLDGKGLALAPASAVATRQQRAPKPTP